jgi:hypothetical protein
MNQLNDEAAVYQAMLKAGFRRQTKLTPAEYAERMARETLSLQRHYLDIFALWRRCGRPHCRRQQKCFGDVGRCFKYGIADVPRDEQRKARATVVAAMPGNIGAPEREARLLMPQDVVK